MKIGLRFILVYSLSISLLVIFLSLIQYSRLVHDMSNEVYSGVIATTFTLLGIWVGTKFLARKKEKEVSDSAHQEGSVIDLSRREMDVLALIASGLSNQEIADKLCISLNTVKTHSSNIFLKLDVRRRTQAVQKARELGIIS